MSKTRRSSRRRPIFELWIVPNLDNLKKLVQRTPGNIKLGSHTSKGRSLPLGEIVKNWYHHGEIGETKLAWNASQWPLNKSVCPFNRWICGATATVMAPYHSRHYIFERWALLNRTTVHIMYRFQNIYHLMCIILYLPARDCWLLSIGPLDTDLKFGSHQTLPYSLVGHCF